MQSSTEGCAQCNKKLLPSHEPMKRRDFLKLAVAGTTLLSRGRAITSPLEPQATAAAAETTPVRGLIEKGGRFFQPVRIPIPTGYTPPTVGTKAVIRLDGVVVDEQPIAPGTGMLESLVPAVQAEQVVNLAAQVSGSTIFSGETTLKPVRRVLVYVLPHSHNDIGYTDIQTKVEQRQLANIQLGIDLARKTAQYPEGSRFVWNMEGCWAADLWLRRMPEAKRAEFADAVQKGWVVLNGMYANELTGLCRPEELLQVFRRGTEIAEQCGVKIDSAMLSDVPGFTWGAATAMTRAGIRYFSAAPNWFDRIGTLMQQWQDRPFWWLSPSGKERVLVWVPWTGYAMSHVFKKITPEWVGQYQDRLDQVNFPYDISYIRWSGHGDNAEPDPAICEDIQTWNAQFSWPKFVISSTSRAFSAFQEEYGKELPEFKGDLTPYWEDGAGSSALETGINRNTADRLVQAEALFAMSSPSGYPRDAFANAWRNVLLYSEHTWGAWNSVSDSESQFVKDQWEMKRSFAIEGAHQSRELLDRAISHARGRPASPNQNALDIYNTCSWPRGEIVVLPRELSAAGECVSTEDGKAVFSQKLSTGELAFWAADVPPFSSARYRLSPGISNKPPVPVRADETQIDNDTLQLRVDAKTGGVSELYCRGLSENLVDTMAREQINQYLFLAGNDLANLQTNGLVKVSIEDAGPLIATLRIESEAPGCNSLVRKIRVAAASDYVELINIVDKRRAPMNPNPGKGGPGDYWAQHGGKESVQFAFPFNVKDGRIRIDVPLAVMRPEIDQLPGSCKNWLPVGRWIDVANDEYGVTWATLDAPLVEIGEISATLLGSQRNPSVWRKHVAPTQKFYSWVMNNHWGTNYRAYQEGEATFRYALRPHKGHDAAAAARFATALSQPLIPAPAAASDAHRTPLLRVDPDDVLVTALKPSDDGQAWILRLFGASGEDREAKLVWSSPQRKSLWLSDLNEKPVRKSGDSILVRAWDLVTLRVEKA